MKTAGGFVIWKGLTNAPALHLRSVARKIRIVLGCVILLLGTIIMLASIPRMGSFSEAIATAVLSFTMSAILILVCLSVFPVQRLDRHSICTERWWLYIFRLILSSFTLLILLGYVGLTQPTNTRDVTFRSFVSGGLYVVLTLLLSLLLIQCLLIQGVKWLGRRREIGGILARRHRGGYKNRVYYEDWSIITRDGKSFSPSDKILLIR